MRHSPVWLASLGLATVLTATLAGAQPQPTAATLARIRTEGYENSRIVPLAQALLDSLGPRLTGSPGQKAAQAWAIEKYREWGIPARNEQYGTWMAWRRGPTHIDLMEPRIRSIEGTMLAWSPGTTGPVTGEVVTVPESGFAAWLPTVRGKFVMLSFPQPTCRPDDSWQRFAAPGSFEAMQQQRTASRDAWTRRLQGAGVPTVAALARLVEGAGAAGVLTSSWTGGWGVDQVHQASTTQVPMLDIACEDYGLLARLADNRQNPVIRLNAEAEPLGVQPVFNTIAEIRGSELPNEYVILSAHFDSWDAASGATDNGTGTIAVMEAMRILRTVYPQPRRTILAAHWSGEEQGLDGSEAFVADHPEIVAGLQALFNQDTGTGRTTRISMHGLSRVAPFFERWMAAMPSTLTQGITLDNPGAPRTGGSDYSSFICTGAPSFDLRALDWEYGMYTWHSNRDTFDKIAWDDLRANAVVMAMFAYQAANDERIPRERAPLVDNRTGGPLVWPVCQQPARTRPTG